MKNTYLPILNKLKIHNLICMTLAIIITIFNMFNHTYANTTNNEYVNEYVWLNLELKYDGAIHNYSAGKIYLVINGETLTDVTVEPVILDSRTLVPLRSIFEKTGAIVSWDNENREAIIEKNGNIVAFDVDSNTALKNNTETIIFDVPAKIINDYTMVPIRAISDALGYEVLWENDDRTVYINYEDSIETTTETTTQTTTEDITEATSSEITSSEMSEELSEETSEDISEITTEDITETISEITTESTTEITTEITTEFTTSAPESSDNIIQKQDGIKILWDQVSESTNDSIASRIPISGLDVISPTWFKLKNSNGDIEDIGSQDYVKWAKSQGYEVWGLVTNAFDESLTHTVLSDVTKRTNMINQLVSVAKKYDLDGINIDFESVGKSDGDIYLKFIEEASIAFKSNNLITSVDTFVPTPWTEQYKLEEVGKIVDYVIIMSYDEHYRTSTTSGSTASLPWVEKYMDDAIKAVDKDKLIMGVPFYTRLWSEVTQSDGTIKVTESVAVTMEEVSNLITSKNLIPVWLEDTKQYYVEYTEDSVTKKLWIEDMQSMEERMKLSRSYDVKGIAAWKRGYETEGIWEIINKYYE